MFQSKQYILEDGHILQLKPCEVMNNVFKLFMKSLLVLKRSNTHRWFNDFSTVMQFVAVFVTYISVDLG